MAGQGNTLTPSLFSHLRLWGSLVRFSHTIFALPFALAMALVASRDHPITATQIVLLIVALASARTAAMSFNRLIDRRIDGENPRTRERELPSGRLSVGSVSALLTVSSIVFFIAAWSLGWHCLVLAPPVLLTLFAYSLTKRFTSASHFVLGLALACAPGGVWYAITAEFAWLPVWMMCGVLFWVAGFDILYSLQDERFDKGAGLFSIPARFGSRSALLISRVSHLIATCWFIWFGLQASMGIPYWLALTFFAAMLCSQHLTISPERPEAIEAAFFTRNAWGSVILFVGVLVDHLLRS